MAFSGLGLVAFDVEIFDLAHHVVVLVNYAKEFLTRDDSADFSNCTRAIFLVINIVFLSFREIHVSSWDITLCYFYSRNKIDICDNISRFGIIFVATFSDFKPFHELGVLVALWVFKLVNKSFMLHFFLFSNFKRHNYFFFLYILNKP